MARNNGEQEIDKEDKGIRLDAILAEYNTLREEMRMFLQFHRRDTYLAAIVAGGVVAYMGENLKNLPAFIYAIIPSVIFVYILCQLINLYHVSLQAKACKRVEERVNNLFGTDNIMDWETTVAKKLMRKPSSPVWWAIFGIIFVIIILFLVFVYKAWSQYGWLLRLLHIGEFIVISIVLVKWAKFEFKFDEKSI